MKCLFSKTANEFINFASEVAGNWYVMEDTIKNRYDSLGLNSSKEILEKQANKNNIQYNQTEVISWLDNMSELLYVFEEIQNKIDKKKLNSNFLENMHIIAEYHIPFNKNRIDYLITKDDKILLIEFSYCDNEKSKEHYKRKLNQVIYYQDLLKTCLSEHIKINIFTFLIKPERIGYKKLIYTNSNHEEEKVFSNYDECLYLIELIIHTFSNTKKTAIEELELYGDKYQRF